jgi:hypothetical protein
MIGRHAPSDGWGRLRQRLEHHSEQPRHDERDAQRDREGDDDSPAQGASVVADHVRAA